MQRHRAAAADRAPAPSGHRWARARISKKLTPPAAGTQRWLLRYGEALVTVRYRDDPERGRRAVTVELLVDERDLPAMLQAHEPVRVRIRYGERELAAQARAAGGHWDPDSRFWRMTRQQAVAAGLADRIEPTE